MTASQFTTTFQHLSRAVPAFCRTSGTLAFADATAQRDQLFGQIEMLDAYIVRHYGFLEDSIVHDVERLETLLSECEIYAD